MKRVYTKYDKLSRMKGLGILVLVVVVAAVGWWKHNETKMKPTVKLAVISELNLVWGTSRWKWAVEELGWQYEEVTNLPAQYVWDENRMMEAIASISAQINIPAAEPEIKIENGQVKITEGENGQEVDERRLVEEVKLALSMMRTEEITVPVVRIEPKLTEAQVEQMRMRGERLKNKIVEIEFSAEKQSWKFDQEQILRWINPAGGWKQAAIEVWGEEMATNINRGPQNASFRWLGAGKVEAFAPARPGWKVDEKLLVNRLIGSLGELEKTEEPEKKIELPVGQIEPEIKTGDANNLGIIELIGKGESWFTGSITNRIFNLKKAAGELNGVLVAPGETFSFNQVIGDVSAATGYKQAYVIKEGKTILGDGGGVCQVSSTLFRAVLAAGLPIEARTAHAYRVSYYEIKYQPGFDATVWQPDPDFKFKNDTPGYILIQTVYDEKNKYLAFEIYGASDGRKVETSKARVWEVMSPPPDLYVDDPTLQAGKIVQTEHAANGAKVAFDWKVTRGDEVLQERTFYSVYRPWQAVYLRGTKPN
ncbi:VanW family protein [Candidatus Amesbacteria bacterium]|nr:VanW family protein [Candidatus Amesbacteria bacterium]